MGRYPKGIEKNMAAIEHGQHALLVAIELCTDALVHNITLFSVSKERAEAEFRESRDPKDLARHDDFSRALKMSTEAFRALTDARARMEGGQLAFMEEGDGEGDSRPN